MLRVTAVILTPLLLTACGEKPSALHPEPPKNAYQQFDPPAPGVANRPLLNMGGHY